MSVFTFKRGIHPPHSKSLTENQAIQIVMPKEKVVIPLLQHIGAPAVSLVQKGDVVKVGQKIGEAKGFVSVPVHSTVSGTVKSVNEMLHPSGSKVMSVVIENDFNYSEIDSMKPLKEWENMSNEDIITCIKEAGIVGMGGAGFPTFIKLNPPADKKIEYIIVNGAECEPYLTSDYRILLEETEKVIKGLTVLLKLFPKAKGVIAVEDNKPEAIAKLKSILTPDENIEIVTLKTKYPQGAEKQLIYSVTNRTVPIGALPADVGCIVHNIDTVVAVHRAIFRGRPLMRRVVTVSGGAIKNPGNFKVKLGTSYQEVIDAAGGFSKEPAKLISGGPMMGVAIFDLNIPVIKSTSSILCLSEDEVDAQKESSCIRCGKCASACPMNLVPLELDRFARNSNTEKFVKYKGMACMECGSCSYVCPAKRHLVQSIRSIRRQLLAAPKK